MGSKNIKIKKKRKKGKKKKAVITAAVLAPLLAWYIYRSHNPSYYAISSDGIESHSGEVAGERDFQVNLTNSTIDEVNDRFNSFYRARYGAEPASSNVGEQDLIDFGIKYTGGKLDFRHSVLFPQFVVDMIRGVPYGDSLMPKKRHEYFEKLGTIDVAGEEGRLTDCFDYSQLFRETFNLLSQQYGVGSSSYRVNGGMYLGSRRLGMGIGVGDHDFNLVRNVDGTNRYIDSNGADTKWISNPVDITHKVRVMYHNKSPGKK